MFHTKLGFIIAQRASTEKVNCALSTGEEIPGYHADVYRYPQSRLPHHLIGEEMRLK